MKARLAIAGNPNAGKTSIFNELTGATQHVSNYPGVTVERKEGKARIAGHELTIVDLPGTYSLTAYSLEEIVARDFLIEDKPDLVIDVVDASNLERNLYLTVQIMEIGAPLVIALNMVDVARKRGINIDAARLSQLLGAPVVATVGSRGEGVRELLEACLKKLDSDPARQDRRAPAPINYGPDVDGEIDRLAADLAKISALAAKYDPRWIALKLIEGDEEVIARTRALCEADPSGAPEIGAIRQATDRAVRAIEKRFSDDVATVLAEHRYGFASGVIQQCVTLTGEARQNVTDIIDTIVCNRALGPLILVAVVVALFFFVFTLADEWAWIPWFGGAVSPTGLFEWVFAQLSQALAPLESRAPVLHSLLDDGVIGGVGGVMGFVPLIFFLFLFISILEDTGYIARIAFILDRALRAFGLQGKSIMAMVVSGGLGAGGCAVPGVMATRTLREEKDRLVTMLVAPFMNCGAKMPVYAMLIAAFFPDGRTRMMLTLWAISWIVALLAAWTLRRFVVRGEQTPFVMELPPYHIPTLRGVLRLTWERTWMYLKKAGTIILAISVLLWAFMYLPRPPREDRAAPDMPAAAHALAHSFAGRLGVALQPVSQLAGFEWRTNIALLGGFAAKEVVVGTLGTAYAMGEAGDADDSAPLSERLAADPAWNRLRAFALMIFVMLYSPCFVTLTVIRRESGSWKWAAFSTAYSTTIAFTLATIVYQTGRAFGWGQ